MSRFFTLQQAERLIPQVESGLRAAISLKSEYAAAETEVQQTSRHIMMSGGVQVDVNQVMKQKERRDAISSRLKEAVENINEIGCVIKDLDVGLIDFPTMFRGQEVYLCWKLGEPAIQFWHGVEEGFRGRKKIDQDFLDNHRGELPN